MPENLKKINNKWYKSDNTQYYGGAIIDGNRYWLGMDNSETYLRKAGQYQPSQSIINYVKKTEAFSPKWYKDENGYWTIGFGMKETPELRKKYPKSITLEQATAEFNNLAQIYAQEMYNNTPNANMLNQNQLDALFSYYYNLGQNNYTKHSPAFQNALRNRDWNEVTKQMDYGYNDPKNPGLKIRRDFEKKLFQTPMKVPIYQSKKLQPKTNQPKFRLQDYFHFASGGILKFQSPSQPISRATNEYYKGTGWHFIKGNKLKQSDPN